jgi:tetraacyldisaccharide-1-P 4'-kinase
MLARRFEGPVIVGAERVAAGALAVREFGAEVLVLDDGFQHWALRRDFDLVCWRGSSFGDDCLLPAGRLREPLRALRRAQAVLVSGGEEGERLGARVERALAGLPVYHGPGDRAGDARRRRLARAADGRSGGPSSARRGWPG